MKNTTSVYVLLFSLLTSAATNCSMATLCNKADQGKVNAINECKTFRIERQDWLDQINPKNHNKKSAMEYFAEQAFEKASRDAKNANNHQCTKKEKTTPNKAIVGSAAWAASKK